MLENIVDVFPVVAIPFNEAFLRIHRQGIVDGGFAWQAHPLAVRYCSALAAGPEELARVGDDDATGGVRGWNFVDGADEGDGGTGGDGVVADDAVCEDAEVVVAFTEEDGDAGGEGEVVAGEDIGVWRCWRSVEGDADFGEFEFLEAVEDDGSDAG